MRSASAAARSQQAAGRDGQRATRVGNNAAYTRGYNEVPKVFVRARLVPAAMRAGRVPWPYHY